MKKSNQSKLQGITTRQNKKQILFNREIAFANYEEIRIKALEKQLYNIARSVIKNQCELFNLSNTASLPTPIEDSHTPDLEKEFKQAFAVKISKTQ